MTSPTASPPIEQCARAVARASCGSIAPEDIRIAIAVLIALRDNITPGMIEAGMSVTLEWCTKRDRIAGSDAAAIFTAMLDRAIGEDFSTRQRGT